MSSERHVKVFKNGRNRIIKGRPSWSRLSSLRMTTYERSTLNEQ